MVDRESSEVARAIFGTGAGDFKWLSDMLRYDMAAPCEREASCARGRPRIRRAGDPKRVSPCHCFACQCCIGAPLGSTSFFARSQIASIEGNDRPFRRAGDSGPVLTSHFRPPCDSDVFWDGDSNREMIGAAYADPAFPMLARVVRAEYKHERLPFPEKIPWHRESPV